MATVRIKFNSSAQSTVRYVFSHRQEHDPVEAQGCASKEQLIINDFKAVRDAHGSHNGNEVAHVVQSWSPSESSKLSLESVNQMGFELASRYFPGHQFVVVTHSDKAHLHNHIVINSVSVETGKRIHNKIKHWKSLTLINDDISRERGLSIPHGEARDRALRMSDKVQRMLKYHRFSYLFDTAQKADFARCYATSYAEYVGILSEFGVGTRVEDKNITYFYAGSTAGIRGKSLGRAYDKAGLEAVFKSNDERFQQVPGLRHAVRQKIDHVRDTPAAIDRVAKELMGQSPGGVQINTRKDYSEFKRAPRREMPIWHVAEHDLASSMVPVDEIKKARHASIIDYCRRSGIALEKNHQGELTLKGRDYVVIKETEWINRKNRTSGSLIDLVASHKKLTFLQAIADINNNPRLLLLESHLGEAQRKFTSFHVPDTERMERRAALHKLSSLLSTHDANPAAAESLLKTQLAQVSRQGVIRLFGKDSSGGALEFYPDEHGRWQRRKQGTVNSPLASMSGRGGTAVIYTDPFSFLKGAGHESLASKRAPNPTLVMLTPDEKVVDRFVAENQHVHAIHLVSRDPKNASPVELDFFNNLKGRYHHLSIQVDLVGLDRATRDLSPEISR